MLEAVGLFLLNMNETPFLVEYGGGSNNTLLMVKLCTPLMFIASNFVATYNVMIF